MRACRNGRREIVSDLHLTLPCHASSVREARTAVADLASGTWHPQELREPVDGRVRPIVTQGLAVYNLGRYVYAADSSDLDLAFTRVASELLRLAR